MKCPACGNTLSERTVGDVAVDVCEGGCGGVWFDWFELQKFDEVAEVAPQELLEIEEGENVSVERDHSFKCPKCDDVVMLRHFFSVKQEVEVDECPSCGGYWLDSGELGKIRSLFETEQDRHEAAREHFGERFGDELARMESENEAGLERVRKMSRLFRFICPSYYVGGKQDWGAF